MVRLAELKKGTAIFSLSELKLEPNHIEMHKISMLLGCPYLVNLNLASYISMHI